MDGPALYYKWASNVYIENNLFYQIDYGCLAEGYTFNGNKANNVTFRRNTIDTSGDSEGLRVANTDETQPVLVELNYFTGMGKLQTDGSAVQVAPTSPPNSVSRYNWFIDNTRTSFRFDGNPGGQK